MKNGRKKIKRCITLWNPCIIFKNDKHKSCNINLAKISFKKYQTSVGINPQTY